MKNTAMWYVERKKAKHRFDGVVSSCDATKSPTCDMLERRELVA